jgi:NADH:ubiquinone oxidoreductase subunit B-like Fe-S oxidoreductase
MTISQSVYHHGKRHVFSVTPRDPSPEALKEAFAELTEKVSEFKEKSASNPDRTSYRKSKKRK